MASQRLAVGTSEGAIVMYDLKTAIRLYVLEGHKKMITACSFSPDGRRLVTLSLEESVVLVWKVGSSFSSFFNPGAPPRQGHGPGEPFKTLSFNVGDEGAWADISCVFADGPGPASNRDDRGKLDVGALRVGGGTERAAENSRKHSDFVF